MALQSLGQSTPSIAEPVVGDDKSVLHQLEEFQVTKSFENARLKESFRVDAEKLDAEPETTTANPKKRPLRTKKSSCSLALERFEAQFEDPKRLLDYLSVVRVISGLPLVVSYDLLANAVSPPKKRRSFRDTALDSVMGHCYRSSTLRQLRMLTGIRPLREELASMYYKVSGCTRGLNFNRAFHADGYVARWVHEAPDRQPNDPVLLYFHGGGYALKTCQPQISYICEVAKVFAKRRLSVVVLDYTIAPFARFPVQRNQALACLNALQKTCDNIILLGDSCGGNLALSVLLEESGPQKVDHSRIMGCVLISPWVDPAAEGGSMKSKRDILSGKRLGEMTKNFVTKEQLNDPRVSPIKADAATWHRVLPANTCCVWGDIECLADQVKEFVGIAGIKDIFEEHNGTHDCILRGIQPEPCRYINEQLLRWIVPDEYNELKRAQEVPNRRLSILSRLSPSSYSLAQCLRSPNSSSTSSRIAEPKTPDNKVSSRSSSKGSSRHSMSLSSSSSITSRILNRSPDSQSSVDTVDSPTKIRSGEKGLLKDMPLSSSAPSLPLDRKVAT